MNVKNIPSATTRPIPSQQHIIPSGRLSILEVEALDNNGLLSRFSMNQKFANTNNDLNEINSLLSVSRMSQNNDKGIIIDTNHGSNQNDLKSSAKAYLKFQSNFNILNDMFNNMKTDTNNNESMTQNKNIKSDDLLPPIESPSRNHDEAEKSNDKEKVNDVFINLLKDQKDSSLDFNGTFNSTTSFFLHEPKQQQQSHQKQRMRNDSGTSFMKLAKGNLDNSFDEGFFDSLNIAKRSKPPSGKDIIKKWDDAVIEDDELSSILG